MGDSDRITSGINRGRRFLNPSARLTDRYLPVAEHFTDCVSRTRLHCVLHTKKERRKRERRKKAEAVLGTTTRSVCLMDAVKPHLPDVNGKDSVLSFCTCD